jgi:peptidoglycan/xylan/chitin deacetylase (PgdA/CDA1 family)
VNPLVPVIPSVAAVAAGLAAYGAVHPRSQLFGPTIRYTASPKQLAITFDDGPNPAITPRLLDLLERYKAQATFFLIGKFVRESPDLVREIAAGGHAIGNHTETHPNLFWLGAARLREEIGRCQEAITAATGQAPVMMRPPYGLRNPLVASAARASGIRSVVMWTLIPGDWRAKPAEWLIERMRPIAARAERAQRGAPAQPGGDVLCLHDGDHSRPNGDRERTLAALANWLPRWRDLGLEFVTIASAADRAAH